MHAVIFAGGTLRPGKAVLEALARADFIIAADSGALTALQLGYIPSFIVGDFDSLDVGHEKAEQALSLDLQQLTEQGSKVLQAPVEKNETDTELAVQVAIEHGATTITLLGALGGRRFDHTMANVLLLAGIEVVPIRIVDGPSICWILRGPGSSLIHGQVGDLLSLLPLTTNATGVRTNGLYYPLFGETLYFGRPRGVSNVLTSEHAEVSLEMGMLLIILTDSQELNSYGKN